MNSMGHVVKEGKIGNTAYTICDDFYRNRTKADIDQTIRSLNQSWERILVNMETLTKF